MFTLDNMINKIFNFIPSFNTVQYSLIHLIKHLKFVRVEGKLEKQWRTFTRVRLWRKLKRDGQLNQLRFCIFAFLFKSKWPALFSSLQNLVMPHHSKRSLIEYKITNTLWNKNSKWRADGSLSLSDWHYPYKKIHNNDLQKMGKKKKNTLRLKNSKYELRFSTIKV